MVDAEIPERITFDAMLGYHPYERFEEVTLKPVAAAHGRAAFERV